MLQRGTGTSAGHQRGLLMATSGDLTWPPAGTFSWPRTNLRPISGNRVSAFTMPSRSADLQTATNCPSSRLIPRRYAPVPFPDAAPPCRSVRGLGCYGAMFGVVIRCGHDCALTRRSRPLRGRVHMASRVPTADSGRAPLVPGAIPIARAAICAWSALAHPRRADAGRAPTDSGAATASSRCRRGAIRRRSNHPLVARTTRSGAARRRK